MDKTIQVQDPEPFELIRIEEAIEKLVKDYPDLRNYPRLAKKDLHLAELYRQAIMGEHKTLNRVQAVVKDGKVWIDVLVEAKENIQRTALAEVIQVRGETGRFFSGRVMHENLPKLEKMALRLEAARALSPALSHSVEVIQADQPTLTQNLTDNLPGPEIDGRGVIVGIVDVGGGDFQHPNFRFPKADGTPGDSRILYLWDQNGNGGLVPTRFGYGREFDQNRINQALGTADPYIDLQYIPQNGAHGTHVMDIAAGSGQFPGVAPAADLIFVHLGLPNPIDAELETLGGSTRLYDAVQYIFDKAEELSKPAVVNLSVGAYGGSHDGTSLVEQMFDSLLDQSSGRAIVVAAGNSYQMDIHSHQIVRKGMSVDIEWHIDTVPSSNWWQRQELEIWYDKNAKLSIQLLDPKGNSVGSCPLGDIRWAAVANWAIPPVLIRHLPPDNIPGEDENRVNIFIDDRYWPLPRGVWRVRLELPADAEQTSVEYHAWIERNDEYRSRFLAGTSNQQYTINSIGNAKLPIVVGSYYAAPPTALISYFSASGPSRNPQNHNKPEVCAPGENIYAAWARHVGTYAKSGTSMAAPHVTGLIALMFQAARDRSKTSRTLDISEIRNVIISTADQNPPAVLPGTHDLRFGFGRINAVKALQMII